MTFDVCAFVFSPFIRNRISVHHSKEVEELRLVRRGWRGWLASAIERVAGPFALRRAVAIAGVTHEIGQYEVERSGLNKTILVYANAIDVGSVNELNDDRENHATNVAFMCGTFSSWHGLDRVVKSVAEYSSDGGDVVIHLIGRLSEQQERDIEQNERTRRVFVAHGVMSEEKYRPILSRCDIGLTSFALDRKGLREASTIKVREMLAMGLPVLSGHHDGGVKELSYFRVCSDFSMRDLVGFAAEMKSVSRSDVRRAARGFIDKSAEMARLVSSLRRLS